MESSIDSILENSTTIVQSVNWASPTWDVFIFLLFAIGPFIYGFSLGRNRLIVSMISLYISIALVHSIPSALVVINPDIQNAFLLEITGFIFSYLMIFFFLSRYGLLSTLSEVEAEGNIWQVIVLSYLHVGLFISLVLSFIPPSMMGSFSSLTQMIFMLSWSQLVWLVAPLLSLIVLKTKFWK